MGRKIRTIIYLLLIIGLISVNIYLCLNLKDKKNEILKQNNIINELKKSNEGCKKDIKRKKKDLENAKIELKNKENAIKKCNNSIQNIEKQLEDAKKLASSCNYSEKQTSGEKKYRLTSYYPYNTSNCTGSGKCTKDFTINEKGWYLYKGKLVLAAATTYLKDNYGVINGKHYFKYYDEVGLKIDGIKYKGIILDSCGACMNVKTEERLDLFVKSSKYVIDRGYKGNNPIYITW